MQLQENSILSLESNLSTIQIDDKMDIYKEAFLKITSQRKQFIQWLYKLFGLNNELHTEYNTFYQLLFYIVVYELLTEGRDYNMRNIDSFKPKDDCHNKWFYDKIEEHLEKIRNSLSDEEYVFIEYKRHTACHIFQNQYEHIQDNGKIKEKRKTQNIDDIVCKIETILLKHGGAKECDLYLHKKLYPIICEFYEDIKN